MGGWVTNRSGWLLELLTELINWGDRPLCNIVINQEDPRPPIMYYVIYGQPLMYIRRSRKICLVWLGEIFRPCHMFFCTKKRTHFAAYMGSPPCTIFPRYRDHRNIAQLCTTYNTSHSVSEREKVRQRGSGAESQARALRANQRLYTRN